MGGWGAHLRGLSSQDLSSSRGVLRGRGHGACVPTGLRHRLPAVSPGGLLCRLITRPVLGSGALLCFDWFQRPGRSWLSTYSGPLPETFQGRMDRHVCVCEARCPAGSGTDVSARSGSRLPQTCPVRPLRLCGTWWRAVGGVAFGVHREGRRCVAPSSTICFSVSCLRSSLPTSLDARGPGEAAWATAW